MHVMFCFWRRFVTSSRRLSPSFVSACAASASSPLFLQPRIAFPHSSASSLLALCNARLVVSRCHQKRRERSKWESFFGGFIGHKVATSLCLLLHGVCVYIYTYIHRLSPRFPRLLLITSIIDFSSRLLSCYLKGLPSARPCCSSLF